jgi:hypothetical protein
MDGNKKDKLNILMDWKSEISNFYLILKFQLIKNKSHSGHVSESYRNCCIFQMEEEMFIIIAKLLQPNELDNSLMLPSMNENHQDFSF